MSLMLVTAAVLQLSDYDQLKLAHFLEKLPREVATREVAFLENQRKVKTSFPKNTDAFHVHCESTYFGSASVPSFSKCDVSIDVNHPEVEKNYDELTIKETDSSVASALYSSMSHSSGDRDFRSGDWEPGTDYNGKPTNIFHFLWSCSQTECLYRFSEKVLQ